MGKGKRRKMVTFKILSKWFSFPITIDSCSLNLNLNSYKQSHLALEPSKQVNHSLTRKYTHNSGHFPIAQSEQTKTRKTPSSTQTCGTFSYMAQGKLILGKQTRKKEIKSLINIPICGISRI